MLAFRFRRADNDSIFQHRVAQETVMYKDEQLREAHAWIARVREVDAYQTTTNQTLQAELRERTEQYNQLWMGCQRQVDLPSFLLCRDPNFCRSRK